MNLTQFFMVSHMTLGKVYGQLKLKNLKKAEIVTKGGQRALKASLFILT